MLNMIFIVQLDNPNTANALSAMQASLIVNRMLGIGLIVGLNTAVDSLIS